MHPYLLYKALPQLQQDVRGALDPSFIIEKGSKSVRGNTCGGASVQPISMRWTGPAGEVGGVSRAHGWGQQGACCQGCEVGGTGQRDLKGPCGPQATSYLGDTLGLEEGSGGGGGMHHPRAPVSGTCLWCWSLGLATVHFTAAMTLTILFCFLFFL
jgi:hypothetical protein